MPCISVVHWSSDLIASREFSLSAISYWAFLQVWKHSVFQPLTGQLLTQPRKRPYFRAIGQPFGLISKQCDTPI